MTQHTTQLGIAFVVIGFIAMYLMFHLWGYPYDKEKRLSAAPRWAMLLHRILGYLFTAIYVALMWHMLPRIWEYQVEFPARTTAHIILGFTVGFLLLIKISIVRFFRHFEEWMPALGTGIMLGTVILLGLSLPFIFQEQALAKAAPGGSVFSTASRERVATLLPTAQLPATAPLAELSTTKALASGRRVLLGKCVKCHDLKTILAKPRTPSGWWQTVERMAEKPALFTAMSDRELLEVTAYLIAITPDLQRSAKARRDQDLARAEGMREADDEVAQDGGDEPPPGGGAGSEGAGSGSAGSGSTGSSGSSGSSGSGSGSGTTPATTPTPTPTPRPTVDLAKAKATYENVCSQCHELSDVDADPPRSRREAERLVRRMIAENDAEMSAAEVRLVVAYLEAKFARK